MRRVMFYAIANILFAAAPPGTFVTAEEIKDALPKDGSGINLNQLLSLFPTRKHLLNDPDVKKKFMGLLKENSIFGKDKLLRAKP